MLGDCPDHTYARGLSRLSLCSGTVATILVLGDCLDHHCAQELSRPPSCSGTVPTTIMLGDCSDHSRARDYLDRNRAWGLFRPVSCLGLSRPPSCSGTVLTTLMLRDCPDHSPTIARRPLSLSTCDLYSHTVEMHLFFLT